MLFLLGMLPAGTAFAAAPATLRSPDGRIRVEVETEGELRYTISLDGAVLLSHSEAALELSDGRTIGRNDRVRRIRRRENVCEHIEAPLYRQAAFDFVYNELEIGLASGFGITFRATDEGVAYRFHTDRKGPVTVADETACFNFAEDGRCWLSRSTNAKNPLAMAFQNTYEIKPLTAGCELPAFLPVTVETPAGAKVTILESDLQRYPGMFLTSEEGTTALRGLFAPYPAATDFYPGRRQEYVTAAEPYIARSEGARTYPWRILAITTRDERMPVNNLVYALATPNRIGETEWIRPGFSAWEWWNDWGLTGVGFRAGINMETYKYYIDFASRHGLEYVILDEGWYAPSSGNMLTPVPELDIPELAAYAAKRDVRLILWTVFNVLDKDLEAACAKYAAMGIAGFKVDFLDRDDQTAVEMIHRIAACAAKHRLLLDYHGIFKPTGLNRTYPNIVNYEAVFGMEEVKWGDAERDIPLYDVTFPFIRLMAGYVDYTPGAMRNATRKDFHAVYSNPSSMGTRAHQVATYIVYDSPLTMLCDAPTAYEREAETTDFIAALPRTCDRTEILAGELGEYIVTARRAGEKWYVGGLTSWTPRTLTIPCAFLEAGNYTATIFCDGVNADRNAQDYRIERRTLDPTSELTVELAPGGGFAMILEKNEQR